MATSAPADKTHVIVLERRGMATSYVKRVGRDGGWTMTWDESGARRFTAALAERHASALTTASQRAQFEAREASTA